MPSAARVRVCGKVRDINRILYASFQGLAKRLLKVQGWKLLRAEDRLSFSLLFSFSAVILLGIWRSMAVTLNVRERR